MSLWRLVLLRSAAHVAVAGLCAVAMVALLALVALLARPEAWAAGLGFVMQTGLAIAGTSAVGVVLAASLGCGFWTTRSLIDSGELDAMALLGVSPATALAMRAPVGVGLFLVVALLGFFVEPAAWTAVHRIKGGPATSAAVMARLERGETVVLGAGAAAAKGDDGRLHVARGEARLSADTMVPRGDGWRLQGVRAVLGPASWKVDEMTLRPAGGAAEPRSPLTRGPARLRRLLRSSEGLDYERASLVWHRRLAFPLLAPCVYVVGAVTGRARRRLLAGVGLTAVASLLFLSLRLCDRAVRAGELSGALAGWCPVVLVGLLALLGWTRR